MGMSNRWESLRMLGTVLTKLHPESVIAEYGNQIITSDVFGFPFPAKTFFEALGFKHTSFDLNGKDGALPIDLSEPIPSKYHEQFDCVTNFGCMEHIENQVQAWNNFFQLGKVPSWQLHCLPLAGCWPNHGLYHYPNQTITKFFYRFTYVYQYFPVALTHGDGRKLHTLCFIVQKVKPVTITKDVIDGCCIARGNEGY